MSDPKYNHYIIFLPNGEVVESDTGITEVYRVEGTIAYGLAWHRWASGTWRSLRIAEVPAHMRAYLLINPQKPVHKL